MISSFRQNQESQSKKSLSSYFKIRFISLVEELKTCITIESSWHNYSKGKTKLSSVGCIRSQCVKRKQCFAFYFPRTSATCLQNRHVRGRMQRGAQSCGPTRPPSRLPPGLGPSVRQLPSYSSPRNVKQVSNLRRTPSLRPQAKALQHPNAKTRPIHKDTICFRLVSPHFHQLFSHAVSRRPKALTFHLPQRKGSLYPGQDLIQVLILSWSCEILK